MRYRCGLWLTLLASFVTGAWAGPADQEWIEKQTGLAFPAKLAGLTRSRVQTYGQQALGVSVGYSGEQLLKTDVYVYNKGIKEIPDGVDSKVVKDEIQQCVAEIKKMEQMGYYSSVAELASSIRVFGEDNGQKKALCRSFVYQEERRTGVPSPVKRKSYLLLTGYKNHFFKIRFTFLIEHEATGEQSLESFLSEIAKLLQTREAWTDPRTGITFPPELAGLTRSAVTEYKEQGRGVQVRYSAQDLPNADVEVYNPGIKQIPDGADSDVIKEQFQEWIADIKKQEGKRPIAELPSTVRVFGENKGQKKALCKSLVYQERPGTGVPSPMKRMPLPPFPRPLPPVGPRMPVPPFPPPSPPVGPPTGVASPVKRSTYFLLTGYKNHFLKIRFTFLMEQDAPGERSLEEFLSEMAKLLD